MGEPDKLCDLADLTVYNKHEHGRSKKSEGSKTEALDVLGLSGIAEALPGAKEIEGSSVTEHAGISGDALMSGFVDGMASQLGLQLGNPFLQALAYNSTKFLMLEVSQYIFDGLGGFTSGSTLGFSIAQLTALVEAVLKKLDTVLSEPSKSCGDFIRKALQAMERGRPEIAYGHFREAGTNAVKGFNYSTTATPMIAITRLMIIAEVAIETYDKEKNEFVRLENTNEIQRGQIYAVISSNIDKLMEGLKTLKKESLFSRKKTFEAKNQDVLDVLLGQMLPILIQFQPNQPKPTRAHQFVVIPKYVPLGLEDAVLIGKDDSAVAVWREKYELNVLISMTGHCYRSPIKEIDSETAIIVMNSKVKMSQETSAEFPLNLTKDIMEKIIIKQNGKLFTIMATLEPAVIKNHELSLMNTICLKGNVDCLTSLVQITKRVPDKVNSYDWPPLVCAAMNGNTAVARQLVETHGADVDRESPGGYSALGLAMGYKHLDTVKLLVQHSQRKVVSVPSVAKVKIESVAGLIVMGEGEREEIDKYVTSHGIEIK